MKRSLLRVLCLMLAAAMMLTFVMGCGAQKEAAKPADSAVEQSSAPADSKAEEAAPVDPNAMEWTAKKDPVKFTAFLDSNPNPWDGWGTDPVTQEITKRTGVTVDITIATTTEHEEINAMLASGELPDFIITQNGALRSTLWKQGFAQPLNKLMDQYAPNMKNIIPKDMDKIYKESDGNLYFIPDYYSDVDRVMQLKGIQQTISGFTINMPMYEKIGKPPIATLEDYRNVLKIAKEQLGKDAPLLAYDMTAEYPEDDQKNMAQLINRIYGGGATKTIAEDGTVHLNFRDETYVKALKYINSLYRDGLLSPEIFTTQKQEQKDSILQNQKVFSAWGQPFYVYKYDMTENGPYKPIDPPKEAGIDPKWRAASATIGGGMITSITTACKNPERAILYLEFLLSDEGQMLTYHGIEGKDYTMVDGMPKNSAEKDKMWGEKFTDVQSKMGIINYRVTWFATNWADMLYYYWLNDSKPTYKVDTEVNNKYARNERMNELLIVESDSNEKVIETKVFELWKKTLPKFYLAKSEADLTAAYDEFIKNAEKLGLKDLEAAYTAVNKKWSEVLK